MAQAEANNSSAVEAARDTPSAPDSHRSMEELVFSQHPGTRTPQTPPVAEPFSRVDIELPPKTPAGLVAERQFEPMTPEDRARFIENSPYLKDRYVYSSSGVRFSGHTKYVSCFIIHRDNGIFTGSGDNTARNWDMRSGTCKQVFEGHQGTVLCLLVHDSSSTLYTGSLDRTVRRWKLADGTQLSVFEGHTGGVRCMSCLGNSLFVGCGDGKTKRWDLTDNTEIYNFEGLHESAVYAVKAENDFLWTGGADGVTHCWDIPSGMLCTSYQGHTRYISCIHVVKVESEHYLFTGSGDRTIRKFRMADGEFLVEMKGHMNTVWCMESIPLRGELFSGGADNVVIKWDITKAVELMRFEGHTDCVYSLTICQDEKVHVGVRCDETGEMPIQGVRYKKRGGKGINLSEYAFTRCSANEKAKYIKVETFPVGLYSGSKDCTVRRWNATEPKMDCECFPEGMNFEPVKSLSP